MTAALLDRFIWVGICRRHTGGGRRGRRSAPRLLRVGAAPSANFAPAPPPSQSALALRYRLASQVPAYWVPLLPVQTGTGLRLKRGAVLSTEGAPQPVHALGSILESGHEKCRAKAPMSRAATSGRAGSTAPHTCGSAAAKASAGARAPATCASTQSMRDHRHSALSWSKTDPRRAFSSPADGLQHARDCGPARPLRPAHQSMSRARRPSTRPVDWHRTPAKKAPVSITGHCTDRSEKPRPRLLRSDTDH